MNWRDKKYFLTQTHFAKFETVGRSSPPYPRAHYRTQPVQCKSRHPWPFRHSGSFAESRPTRPWRGRYRFSLIDSFFFDATRIRSQNAYPRAADQPDKNARTDWRRCNIYRYPTCRSRLRSVVRARSRCSIPYLGRGGAGGAAARGGPAGGAAAGAGGRWLPLW